jgi:NADPH2:quinone reductase
VGGYADYICLRPEQLVAVPPGLDPAQAVAVVLNYMTAYQMLHRCAQVQSGQRVLIHAAAGGIGTALLQLGRLAALTMYGTASHRSHETVAALGGIPIDYKHADFVAEISRLTDDGVDAVFDGIGGTHVWRSFRTLRKGGAVVAYGLTSSLRHGRVASGPRHRFRGLSRIGLYKLAARCLLGGRRIRIYSIQRRMWRHPDWFREDLTALFELLRRGKVTPMIAARIPLAEAKRAHELLAGGSAPGKIVLLCGEQAV